MAAKALTLTKLDMDEALASGQIQLAYQPIFSLEDGAIERVEALVRWEHPRLGTMLPAVFLPAFEAEDRLPQLTRRVLEKAAAEFGSWAFRKPSALSVNLSASDMTDQDLPSVVEAVINAVHLEPEKLTFECPVVDIDEDEARPVLKGLKDLGVRLAAEMMRAPDCVADAFDLAPFDEIKTSGRGLLRAARHNHTATLTGAADLLTYAEAKGAKVTAIGAEDAAACLALRTVGFHQVQANVLAPALPIDSVTPRITSAARQVLGFEKPTEPPENSDTEESLAQMSAFYQQRRRAQGEMLRRAAEKRIADESEATLLSSQGIRAVQQTLAESYDHAAESLDESDVSPGEEQETTMEAQSKAGLLMRPDLAAASLGYRASPLRPLTPRPVQERRAEVAKAITDVLESLPAEVTEREGTDAPTDPDDVLDAEVAKLPTLGDDEIAQAAPRSPVHQELSALATKLKAEPEQPKSFLQKRYKFRVTHFWPKPWKRTYLRLINAEEGALAGLTKKRFDPLDSQRGEQNTVPVVSLGDKGASALTVSLDDRSTTAQERA